MQEAEEPNEEDPSATDGKKNSSKAKGNNLLRLISAVLFPIRNLSGDFMWLLCSVYCHIEGWKV